MPNKNADLNGKKVLFVAYFYPPITSTGVPGAMRTIKFIRNLTNGDFHVLTRTPATAEEKSALSHLSLPINNEKIYRVEGWDVFKFLLSLRARLKKTNTPGTTDTPQVSISDNSVYKSAEPEHERQPSTSQKLKDFVYNLCYFPDQAGPWILPAYRKGKALVKENNIDAIFATGSPWSSLITGYLISKATGKPLIADFRDPWINNPFLLSKGKVLDQWSKSLEKKIIEHAAAVSLNTEPLRDEFISRYPHVPTERFFVMPNGFDESDFSGIDTSTQTKGSNKLTLCHAGFLYGVRDPAVLLNAIKIANTKLSAQHKKIRFQQIGDVELAYDIRERYADMLADGSLVLETTRPYQQCLQALNKADWLVNVQPATKSQVPSKLYDYLAINRPILNITPEDGALGQLVKKHDLGKLFGFDDEEKLADALLDIAINPESYQDFTGYKARPLFDYATIAANLSDTILTITHK